MEPAQIRKAVVWGVAAFVLTVVRPVSVGAGLIITVIASVIGALG